MENKHAAAGRKGGLKRTKNTKRRGFGSMSPEQRREAGRKGGLKAGKKHVEA